MQLMTFFSEEGSTRGLKWINGKVKHFNKINNTNKIPHMGWNNISIKQQSPLFKGIEDESYLYFVHSYYCAAKKSTDISATCRYGDVEFCASIWRDNIMATQFHPEKSQSVGLNIFRNFGEL
jgi:glutamine amidotransferase